MSLFEERQFSRQLWLLLLTGVIALASWAIVVQQIVRGEPVGENPMSDWGVVVLALLFGIGLPALILWMHVEIIVRTDGIAISVAPFTRRFIEPEEIAHFASRTVRPLRDYGGWGVRGFGGNRAYLMNGNTGVQLDLVNGDKVFLGSNRPEELENAIAIMKSQRL